MSLAALQETFNPRETQAVNAGYNPEGMPEEKAARMEETLQRFGIALNQGLSQSADAGVNLSKGLTSANMDELPQNGFVAQQVARDAAAQNNGRGV